MIHHQYQGVVSDLLRTSNSGPAEYSLDLDTTKYADFGRILEWTHLTPMAFYFWLKPTSFGGDQVFWSKKDGTQEGWLIHYRGTKVQIYVTNGGWCLVESSVADSVDVWTQYLITYDGVNPNNNGFKVYRNNVDVTSINAGSGDITDIVHNTPMRIGKAAAASWGVYDGILGPCAAIPWLPSAAERTEMYNGGKFFDFTTFVGDSGTAWADMQTSSLGFYVNYLADNVGTSITDLARGAVGTSVNMVDGDKVEDSP
jgi:hypothetical protein